MKPAHAESTPSVHLDRATANLRFRRAMVERQHIPVRTSWKRKTPGTLVSNGTSTTAAEVGQRKSGAEISSAEVGDGLRQLRLLRRVRALAVGVRHRLFFLGDHRALRGKLG